MRLKDRAAGVCLILLAVRCAWALNPALDVSQYAHTSWKNRDGFAKSTINDIVQTADGYLWLATELGILRFDGIRTAPWQPPPDQRLPSNRILVLLAARDGVLWIGTGNGLASWKNGRLREYPEFSGLAIASMIEDHDGIVWAGGLQLGDGKLCEIRGGGVRCYSEILGPRHGVMALHEDPRGNLWVSLFTGVWRWRPGPREFYPIPDEPDGIRGIIDSADGGIFIAARGEVRHLADGKSTVVWPLPDPLRASRTSRMFRDRDGGFWVGTIDGGIVHFHNGRGDIFAEPDGLSGNAVHQFFEDHEGNIWVATDKGLDRFRELSVVSYTRRQGLSSRPQGAVVAARDGSVWLGVNDGLNRLKDGQFTAYRARGANPIPGIRQIEVKGMPEHGTEALFQDSRGRLWFAARQAVGYLENDRFVRSAAPGGAIDAFAEDAAGNMWVAYQYDGLRRITPQNEVMQMPWATLGHKDPGDPMVLDPSGAGVWLGFFQGGVAWVKDGAIRKTYTKTDGLAQERVNDLRFDGEGALWVAAMGGVSRVKNGRVASLNSSNGLPCDVVYWTAEDGERSLWLYMPCGLVRIARPELDAWLAGRGDVRRPVRSVVLENSDGVVTTGNVGGYTPRVARSADGKLWFASVEGIHEVDPLHLPFNKLPPPVHVEQINADHKIYDPAKGAVRLPPLVRDVEIDYAALSLVAPEKVHFRFKLEGEDADWHDVGNRRQAFYNDLPPRRYRFRVAAANNSGVWNEAGASLDFSVDPAYYQTMWFRALVVAAFLAIVAGLYLLRVRQLRRAFDLRMQERVGERLRIARDLHDTLLQSFQGVLLKFSAAAFTLPDSAVESREKLEGIIEQARDAISEGRDAVQGLRSSTLISNDLARSIGLCGEELAREQGDSHAAGFRVNVEGEPRDLPPLMRDEVYRIALEALRNAFRHAEATEIEVELRYGPRRFTLRIRDDGKGIDQQVLRTGGRTGHHGLPGMHERARLAGGSLAVWSRPGTGTEIELTISAAVAYRKITGVPIGSGGEA